MTRQQEYIRKNVQRINFTYRKKYDYRLYNFFERLNKQYKGNHIKLDKELYQSFPEGMKYSSQFTISINRNTDRELYKYLLEIEETQPLADYIRLAVYKYIQEKEVVV